MNFHYEFIEAHQPLPVRHTVHHGDRYHHIAHHWHEALELSYTCSGGIDEFYIDGVCYRTKPGDILIVNSNAVHAVTVYPQPQLQAFSLFFPWDFLQAQSEEFRQLRFTSLLTASHPAYPQLQNDLLKYMQLIKNTPALSDILRLKAVLHNILATLAEYCIESRQKTATVRSEKYRYRLQLILDYIRNHACENITVSSIADQFNYTPEYLSRFFRKHMSMTVCHYLNQIRLQHAWLQLVNSDKPISHIALNAGFPNEKSFSRVFREAYHTPPQRYRQLRKNQ